MISADSGFPTGQYRINIFGLIFFPNIYQISDVVAG